MEVEMYRRRSLGDSFQVVENPLLKIPIEFTIKQRAANSSNQSAKEC